MNKEVRPIETTYKGYRFRSRLEARWAVVFDTLGWQWEYEPEGFDLPSGPYLPDFRVFNIDRGYHWWWEVKPALPQGMRTRPLDTRWVELMQHTRLPFAVVFGIPGPGEHLASLTIAAGETRMSLDVGAPRWAGGESACSVVTDKVGIEWRTTAFAAARSARFEHYATDDSALR